MKTFKMLLILVLAVKQSFAQDTAYISRDKATALFFPATVKIINNPNSDFVVIDKGNGIVTIKALSAHIRPQTLSIQEEATKRIYKIPVAYSYGRAGRRIAYGTVFAGSVPNNRPEREEQVIAQQLASGKRADIATHEKTGGVKAWINKISLAAGRIYLRLDLRNRSNLPYGIDFVRFYIRDRKTVDRTATHEQEIVPLYSTFRSRTVISKDQEVAKVFAFKRFSLSNDEALFVEVYERSGNRHLYLQIKQDDLDDIKVLPAPRYTPQTLAAN
ncbi:DUF4138 domain-containing protein [Mucilaginibacter achroorhodeus]|uniref:DUF4138 domain-containing protein n=1 Tax=Mucilaginibacter achroorhodeus TaxID=2599294 RepID=A0A563U2C9_9SPHI|nr:DUF4138 domain-containing protein [Mucilaginibacter achroorhodeus]TWR25471.1 DUF4138 domain-containing protein [Mucilaginibacter achroorhodeus]